jgi:hypothetical protein
MVTDFETRQSISNDGANSFLQINPDQHLYVGGIPEALYKKVQESYQIRNATSLKGEQKKFMRISKKVQESYQIRNATSLKGEERNFYENFEKFCEQRKYKNISIKSIKIYN